MIKEQQPSSFRELINEKDSVSGFLNKREELREKLVVELSKPAPESPATIEELDSALRHGKIKSILSGLPSSIQRTKDHLTQINQQIEKEAVALAEDHEKKIGLLKRKIARAGVLAREGNLSPDSVKGFKRIYQKEKARSKKAPWLALGFELLEKRREEEEKKRERARLITTLGLLAQKREPEEEAKSEKAVRKEKEKAHTIKFCPETGEIQIDGEDKRPLAKMERALFGFLMQRVGEFVSQEELENTLTEACGIESPKINKRGLNDILYRLRAKIEPDHKKPKLIVAVKVQEGFGHRFGYKLEAKRITFQHRFPDGQRSETDSPIRSREFSSVINTSSKHRISVKELARAARGSDDLKSIKLTYVDLSAIRRKRLPPGWTIRVEKGEVWIEKPEEEKKAAAKAQKENAIFETLTSYLSGHSEIHWETLVERLGPIIVNDPTREQIFEGVHKHRMPTHKNLGDIYFSFVDGLMRKAKKGKLSDEDIARLDQINYLVQSKGKGNLGTFKSSVRRDLRTAARDFYGPGKENKEHWI